MSLEQALTDNTAAVKALTAIIQGASVSPATEPAKKAPKAKASETKETAATGTTSEPSNKGSAAATGPSLKAVTDAVLDFAATESGKAKEILKSFGVSRITELKADVYPKVLAAVEAAKAAIAAELAAGNDDDPSSLV